MPLPGRPAQFLEVYLEDPYRVSVDAGAVSRAPEAVVVGVASRQSTRLLVGGVIHTFHIAFQPAGFHRLFGLNMSGVADAGAPVRDLGLPAVEALVDVIRRAPDFETRVRHCEAWLRLRLASAPPEDATARLARAIRRGAVNASVANLAARSRLSPRQLQRRFREQVGVTPRLYARTVRFEALINARMASPAASWTELAHRFGYFDQAHLSRDAHDFMGAAPGEWDLTLV
ncbi:helix-turn-helix domain-containing protein [Brevundimonas sp. VNH65]|uniref:helix-turn-helix domain-containing protein n=1 Tax=Brevundimonas sp. VNH65 TaxID=3400917 RepID=UPI003C0F5842